MNGLEKRFRILASRWHKETAHLSVVSARAAHPAYQEIIEMGKPALPFILKALQKNPDHHWFWALHTISGEDPGKKGSNFSQARQAWLRWGKQKGYLK